MDARHCPAETGLLLGDTTAAAFVSLFVKRKLLLWALLWAELRVFGWRVLNWRVFGWRVFDGAGVVGSG